MEALRQLGYTHMIYVASGVIVIRKTLSRAHIPTTTTQPNTMCLEVSK